MRKADISYHIHSHLSERDCAKLEHILRSHSGVQRANLSSNKHALTVAYDVDTTNSLLLLSRIRMLDSHASILG
ncbi:MAG: hypothetical protein OEX12_01860 [Gammaproteobacteria bacterium]|nr:hypothetical protein [Gammaproteobacteria bacterium]